MRKNREVAIYVFRGDETLICHRPNDGYWNVIAGQVEDDEGFDAAAARELMEEAALAAPLRDLGVQQTYEVQAEFRHLYPSGEYTVTIRSYVVEAPRNWEPVLNHEHDTYRWCEVEDAAALAHWPEVKAGLRLAAAALTR